MRRYTFAAVAVLLVLFPWRQAPTGNSVAYTIENLATSASIDNLVPAETGINASGQISGTVTNTLNQTRAVRYTDGIGWEYVPGLTWGSTAAGINVHGDIVGTQLVAGLKHAYRYNAGTNLVDDIRPLSGGSASAGLAINDSGEVAGQSDAGNNVLLGFRASPGVPAVQLPTLGGNLGNACGINSSGQVAETSTTASGYSHAARVEADGVTVVDLGTFDGPTGMSVACAIDDLGHVGGFSSANVGTLFRAFRFDTDHLVAVDGVLPSFFSNVESIAKAMSAGWYISTVDFNQYAMLHTDANGAVDLNTQIPPNSGWVLTEIKGINAS
ncbi:MAG TPA: hypothetical protein VFZ98_09915, partial [Vicinamibacterales bacterium]